MYVKHLATDMKLRRARQVLGRLATLQEEHLHSGLLRVDQPPPEELGALAGSVLHTARSALDDLAFSLVVASRRTPRHTSFPIGASAHDYAEQEHSCLRRANQQARDAVRSVTPWKGADDRLWELHRLGADERPLALRVARPEVRVPVRVPTALQVLQATVREPPVASSSHPDLSLVVDEGDLVRDRPVVESLDLLVTHAIDVVARVVAATERH